MRMKITLLTLCLALCLSAVARWTPSPVSARMAAAPACGIVTAFTPATATTAGHIRLDSTNYIISAGTTIIGQPVLFLGASVCLDLTLNGVQQIVPPSKVGGNAVNICGAVNSYTRATPFSQGAISIGSSTFAIEANAEIRGDMLASVGSNMCLTASLNGSGQITRPSAIVVNTVTPVSVCGGVTGYFPATASAAGAFWIGGLNFTVAPGVDLGSVSTGSNSCLQGFVDVTGQLIAPSSVVGNGAGGSKVCGVVTNFRANVLGIEGTLTLGGITLPIADSAYLPNVNKISLGANVCLAPLALSNGAITTGTDIQLSADACLQFAAPLVTHGQSNGEDETFELSSPLVFSVSSGNSTASTFTINPDLFSIPPSLIGSRRLTQGVMAMSPNATVTALSCTDSFWDVIFEIGSKGQSEGDMVTLYLQNPNASGKQVLAMFTVQNGGVVVNSVNPNITLLQSNQPRGAGSFLPLIFPSGPMGARTHTLVLVFSMNSDSPLNGCFQLGVDIKRVGGAGMTTFLPEYVVVKRMGNEVEGGSINTGSTGTYATGLPCGVICNGCFLQPTPTPTATPTSSPTPTPSPTPSPSPSPSVTPTPTPSPTPTPTPPPMPFKCDTICYRSILYYRNLGAAGFPTGSVLIGGVNFNNPVNVRRSLSIVNNALNNNSTAPMAAMNREFVAMQLSLLMAGGGSSPVVFNTFWSPIKCSGVNFAPLTLSNGIVLSPDSLFDTIHNQSVRAIRENNTGDMEKLASILQLLNGKC